MFDESAWSPARQFEDQFERTSTGYLYRRNRRGPAIAVSTGERDRFVAKFRRRTALLWWGVLAAGLAGVVLSVVIASTIAEVSNFGMIVFLVLGPLGLAYFAASLWAFDAPARALRDRAVEAPALTNGEHGRRILARLTYRQLAGVAALGVVFAVFVSMRYDPREGWNALWLLSPAFCLSAACVQAIRKWRLERRGG
jgi:MFS family permease